MNRLRSALAAAVCVGSTGGLAGCDVVGTGSRPEGVVIRYEGMEGGIQTFECASFQLAGIMRQNHNGVLSEGDMTSRGEWRSSNPGVIDVSNGDLETERHSGIYLPAGTVVARNPGNATIQFSFLGMQTTFAVSAEPISEVRMTPEIEYLAPGSYQSFALEARFGDDDVTTDVSSSAYWRIVSGSVPVTLTGTTVQTQSDPVGQPFTLEAQLYACDRRAQRHLTIGAIQALRIVHEQPEHLTIPVGYSDLLHVEADIEGSGGAVQDLTDQITIQQVVGDVDEAELSNNGSAYVVTGLKAGLPVQYRVRYAPLGLDVLTRVMSFETLELQQLRISPEAVTLHYPDTFRFDAVGLFSDGHERPLRRSVTWASENTELLGVATSGAEIGTVTGYGLEGKVEITATRDNSEGPLKAEAVVDIQLP